MKKLTEFSLTSSFELSEITPHVREKITQPSREDLMPDLIIAANWMIIFIKPFDRVCPSLLVLPSYPLSLCLSVLFGGAWTTIEVKTVCRNSADN